MRWYDKDGLVETIIGKNGNPRAPNVKDAREAGLLPSVTSIVDACTPKTGLSRWKENGLIDCAHELHQQADMFGAEAFRELVREHWENHRTEADEGSKIHAEIALSLRSDFVSDEPAVKEAARYVVGLHPSAIMCEHQFTCHMGYAGTVDCILGLDAEEIIIDWKTTNDVNRSYPEHAIQLAAYRIARMCETDKPVRCVNVYLDRAFGTMREKPWDTDELNGYYEPVFMKMLDLFNARNKMGEYRE
jgi:hypothetical protein